MDVKRRNRLVPVEIGTLVVRNPVEERTVLLSGAVMLTLTLLLMIRISAT